MPIIERPVTPRLCKFDLRSSPKRCRSIMPVDARPTLAAPDDDPYLWLEEIEGTRALAWVEQQNTATLARFGDRRLCCRSGHARRHLRPARQHPVHDPPRRRTSTISGRTRRTRAGCGGARRSRAFAPSSPQWDIVLDLDALAASEGEDWIWGGASTLAKTHDRAILSLSRGGGDAAVLREFDITAKTFVSDGFHVPEAKGGTEWLDRDTLLLTSSLGEGMATNSGYARTVRLWRRGTDLDRAPVLFETTPESMACMGLSRSNAGRRDRLVRRQARLLRSQRLDRRSHRAQAQARSADRHLARDPPRLAGRQAANAHGQSAARTHPPDTLLGISLAAFLAGDRDFTVLFEPGERRALQHSSGATAGWCCRSWTSCSRCSRC